MMIGVIGVSLAGVFLPPMLKPSRPSSFLKKRVFSQSFSMRSGSCSQNIERRDARCRHRRRMRSREQERPSAVIEKLDQVARPADVSAERADGFRERAHLDVHSPVHVEMIDGAAPVASQHAGRVRVVDHHDRAIFFGQIAQRRAAGRCRRPSRTRHR